jgi:hypothetical protein
MRNHVPLLLMVRDSATTSAACFQIPVSKGKIMQNAEFCMFCYYRNKRLTACPHAAAGRTVRPDDAAAAMPPPAAARPPVPPPQPKQPR